MGAKIQAFDIFQTPLSSHYPLPLSSVGVLESQDNSVNKWIVLHLVDKHNKITVLLCPWVYQKVLMIYSLCFIQNSAYMQCDVYFSLFHVLFRVNNECIKNREARISIDLVKDEVNTSFFKKKSHFLNYIRKHDKISQNKEPVVIILHWDLTRIIWGYVKS